jgi:hypothetical protein
MNVLLAYRDQSPRVRLQITTNGSGTQTKNVLSQLPPDIEVINSAKRSHVHSFFPFNVAPVDSKMYAFAEYTNACFRAEEHGIGLTPYGYYPCAIAGGIDRVFGFDVGRKVAPDPDDPMTGLLQQFCRLCGFFSYSRSRTDLEMLSPSWEVAYERYRTKKPTLSYY